MTKRCMQKGTIVILEDDFKLNQKIQSTLKVLKLPLKSFERSDEFIKYWRLNAQNTALILLDLQLPCINGADLIPLIKRTNPLTKIIIITANTVQNLKLKLYFKGIDDFLAKPFTPTILIPLIQRRLEFPCNKLKLSEAKAEYQAEQTYKITDNLIYKAQLQLLIDTNTNRALFLTKREDQLFRLFLVAKNYTLYSKQILLMLPFIRSKRTLSTWISRLNKKLYKLDQKLSIRSIYNVGYTLQTK